MLMKPSEVLRLTKQMKLLGVKEFQVLDLKVVFGDSPAVAHPLPTKEEPKPLSAKELKERRRKEELGLD